MQKLRRREMATAAREEAAEAAADVVADAEHRLSHHDTVELEEMEFALFEEAVGVASLQVGCRATHAAAWLLTNT